MQTTRDNEVSVWGPYPNYDDIARFEYGRLLWRSVEMRSRLLSHWLDPRHPYRDRFGEQRALIEEVLDSDEPPAVVDRRLRTQGTSLRCISREIPPVFGSFF
jgi:hypothetical protein